MALDVAAGSREAVSYLAGRKDDLGILARAVRDPQPSTARLDGASDLRAMLEDQAVVLTQTRDLVVTLAGTDRTNEPKQVRHVDTNEPKDPAPTSLVILHHDPGAARQQDTDYTNEPKNAALEVMPSLYTNEPKLASPVALTMYGTNEPKPAPSAATSAFRTNEPEEKKSTVLHSIVEMVAKEQVRRLQGATGAPPLAASQDEQLMAVLVDRVLARLDQVTERVNAKAPATAERRAS